MGEWNRQRAADLDAADPLAELRDAFHLPSGIIYLDGNSLGALPRTTPGRLEQVVRQEWGKDLIRSWDRHGWIDLPRRLGDKVGRLLGAAPGQVLVADSTSVNLYKALAAAVGLRPGRHRIVCEADGFPTDGYMAAGLAAASAGRIELRPAPADRILEAVDSQVAVVTLAHVDYRSGQLRNLEEMTRAIHSQGALVVWDLAHSAGVMPIHLDDCGVDFAVGCGYKFLNGGPGAPAFIYVAKRWHADARQPLSGWMGHADPFAFEATYRPAPGIERFACGTPSILAMSALEAGVDLLLAVDLEVVRRKSQALSQAFLELAAEECPDLRPACPADPAARGSQVSFRHPGGAAISRGLREMGVVGDFRPPQLLRLGFAPLYLRFTDLWDAVGMLWEVLRARVWELPAYQQHDERVS